MMQFDAFFFGVFPYVCVAIAITGIWFRLRQAPRGISTKSTQFLASKSLRLGSGLFHIGIVGLFFGHLFGLFTPPWFYHLFGLDAGTKQLIEIGAGFVVSPITLAGIGILLWRRHFDPMVKAISTPADSMLLIVLAIQTLLGFATISQSIHHLDGSILIQLCAWAQGLWGLQIDNWQLIAPQHWIYKAHLVLGFAIVAVLPFSKLMHVLSGMFLWRYVLRPWQVVRGYPKERFISRK
jgi:nitrate reductase gamma subunit